MRYYWKNTKHEGLTPDMISEHLVQLRGITDALHTMHHASYVRSQHGSQSGRDSSTASSNSHSPDRRTYSRHSTDDPNTRPSRTSNDLRTTSTQEDIPGFLVQDFSQLSPEVTVEDVDGANGEPMPGIQRRNTQEYENWRHGDIKPENILRFTDGTTGLGILKLADLGRAKQRLFETSNLAELDRDLYRTRPYEPPDFYIQPDKSMSRLFDTWSLGCVFFESIVWMLYGKRWLQHVEDLTGSAKHEETPFWTRVGDDSAIISDIVDDCMDHMLNNDPECNGKSSALRDMLLLIRNKMLVIDLPKITDLYTEGTRANTETILKDLDDIIAKGAEVSYLFTGNDRLNVQPLPDPIPNLPSARSKNLNVNAARRQSKETLTVPGRSRSSKTMTQLLNTYTNTLNNSWKYESDDPFARTIFQNNAASYSEEFPDPDDQMLCGFCQKPNIFDPGIWTNRKVQDLKPKCSLCAMLLTHTRAAALQGTDRIQLLIDEPGLLLKDRAGKFTQNLRLRLCRSLCKSNREFYCSVY